MGRGRFSLVVEEVLDASVRMILPESEPSLETIQTVAVMMKEKIEDLRPDGVELQVIKRAAIDHCKMLGYGGMSGIFSAVIKPNPGENGRPGERRIEELEPWDFEVSGADVLTEVESAIRRFHAISEAEAVVCAGWVLFAHVMDSFDVSPILAITSPERGCGKTTLLTLLDRLVPRPLMASNMTSASVFRVVEALRPTLLIDEADTFMKSNEELRGIVNSGHYRAGAYVVRCDGDDHEVRRFSTWSPKVIAAIGTLPGTIMDRSLVIRMRRARRDDVREDLRLDRSGELVPLHRKLVRWAEESRAALERADPGLPDFLKGRVADNCRPLIAVADACGGGWPQRMRCALVTIHGVDDGQSTGAQLLDDIRTMFREVRTDRLSSSSIVERLAQREDRPWPEWRHGRPITPRQLARLLRPFGITPKQMRIGEKTRGYELEAFDDAFSRYLSFRGLSLRPVRGPDNALGVPPHDVASTGHAAGQRIGCLRNSFRAAVRRAELPLDLHQHDLRHRRVTTWLAEGKNPVHVKEALGHSDLRTTMAYTHLVRENLRSLVDEPTSALASSAG